MGSLINRDELRRLEKAAREKDKKKLSDWIMQFEAQLDTMLRRDYEKAYQIEIENSVQNFLLAVAYTAYFSEESKIDKDNLKEYLTDLMVTVDLFRTGEYKPDDYIKQLKEEGIDFGDYPYDYDQVYKLTLQIFDKDLLNFIRGEYRKLITVAGSTKYKEDILNMARDLTTQGYITLTDDVYTHSSNMQILPEEQALLDEMMKEKVLISDILYVVNKDGYIGNGTKELIKYAQEHNKEIRYMEDIEGE